MVSSYPNRIIRAQQTINALEERKFSEREMRGLSKAEKQFIADNGYHVRLVQNNTYFGLYNGVYYMFIARNLSTGKKQLYAITKHQSILPNEKTDGIFNYEKWLVLNTKEVCFKPLYYERRFCTMPNVTLVFA